ncbi:MAG TPA: hypothetical protein VLV25_09510 [Steroidobacteraceae bacterium]|nr:hypothetical protein [Steroidobacteraceae bacterium]
MDPKLITPILVTALVVWGIVRRLRRTFGRQPVQPVRIWFRIGVLTLAGGLIAAASVMRGPEMLEALIGGLACGAALAGAGLRHTRFEVTPEGRFYTPHTYIGLAVTLLFLGRLLYRFLYLANGTNGMFAPDPNAAAAYQRSPLTVGIFAVLVGYYLLYNAGILLRTRASELPAPDPVSPE